MIGLRDGHMGKNLTQNGEPQAYSWGTHKEEKKKNRPGWLGVKHQ